jgi:hypothetical protein
MRHLSLFQRLATILAIIAIAFVAVAAMQTVRAA